MRFKMHNMLFNEDINYYIYLKMIVYLYFTHLSLLLRIEKIQPKFETQLTNKQHNLSTTILLHLKRVT